MKKTQVVILCGGKGTRLREHTEEIPKPMVEIGGMPILWHIMKSYAHHGFKDFVLCLGYKGEKIKEFFVNYQEWRKSDFHLNWSRHERHISYPVDSEDDIENWNIVFADTGLETNTGGRIKRIEKYVHSSPFFATYGDGLSQVDLNQLLKYHEKHKKAATMVCVKPRIQFGIVNLAKGDAIASYSEKPRSEKWVNGGFFVFSKEVFRYIGENDVLEKEPFEKMARDKNFVAYPYDGFWGCMDTYKDNEVLNELWHNGKAPWKTWKK